MLVFQPLKPELYISPLAQALQVMEEAGELAEKVGLLTGATGKRKKIPKDIVEQVCMEAMDVAQAACGVVYALSSTYNADIKELMKRHTNKMKERGYLDEIPKNEAIKIMGLYRNSRNGKLYRVINVDPINEEVLYTSEDGQLWTRPISEWFGKNRNGQVRFAEVEDDKTIMWPKEA